MGKPTAMQYRRFGRTNLELSVFSLGGMRFPRGWDKGINLDDLTESERETLVGLLDRSFEIGINHIETARGYGCSEEWLGLLLDGRPRDQYYLQTKVSPHADPAEFEATLEQSFANLRCDYLDLFGFHGINSQEELDFTIRPGGCLEVVRRWQEAGRIRHIGFSTHGSCDVIVAAINTNEFDYVNLHWYFINQSNWRAIEAARIRDMGVFIISPTDKGGQLFNPPAKLLEACAPLHPITFNDLFCLSRLEVHTLSLGAGSPTDFDEHLAALDYYEKIDATIRPIETRLHESMQNALGEDWWPSYAEGLPWYTEVPGEVNLLYILRLWSLGKGLDMVDYGKYRYGMIEGGDGGNWMGGKPSGDFDEAAIRNLLKDHPHRDRIPTILHEAHEMFEGEKKRRLSSD
jgi:predicted aldo/keto reductase-like oxidoreductase